MGEKIQMNHIFENFYLNEKNNKIIVISMLINAVLCIIACYTNISMIFGIICNVLTFVGVSLFSFKKDSSDLHINYVSDGEIQVNRQKRFNIFEGKKGILILTGESGIGKSKLLKQFVENLRNNECLYIDNNYFYDWSLDDFQGKKYIILDQFEKALTDISFEDKISFINDLRSQNSLIIISVRKEFLADIYHALKFDKETSIAWLNFDSDEIGEIKKYLQKIIGESNLANTKYELYNDIINDLPKGSITFIQLSYISKCILYSEDSINSVNIDWIRNKNYDEIIYSFLEKQIDSFVYHDLAYIILYLMCQDKKGMYINQITDFQNISMYTKDIIIKALDFLLHQKLLNKVQTSEGIRSQATEKYEISHDYLLDLLEKLCVNKVDASVRSNIDFYNKNYQIKRNEWIKYNESSKAKINKKYIYFMENKSKSYVTVLLYLMIISISLLNCKTLILLLQENNRNNSCLILAAINVMVGESIYYIYNYYFQFLRIFGMRYIISIIFGILSCLLAYINLSYWAVCLGAEITLMGVLMLFININVRKSEKKFFLTRFGTFFAIGVITLILGYYFPIYSDGKMRQALPLFLLYGGYMFLGIWGHINKTYILALIGKTLLIGKDLEEK